MPFILAVSTNSACKVAIVAARRLRIRTVEKPSAMVSAGRNREYRCPANPAPNPLIGKIVRCTLNTISKMMPSQKAGMAKLTVKNTRLAWSTMPPRRMPEMKPSGSEIAAASRAA